MKNIFRSIKFQISLAFVLMALPIVVLTYSNAYSQKVFDEAIARSIEQARFIELSNDLESDVMDIQRNVLIYKSTASVGALSNVEELYQKISQTIDEFFKLESSESYRESLERIEVHLTEYKHSFDLVKDYRDQKMGLVNEYLLRNADEYYTELNEHGMDNTLIKPRFSEIESAALGYLVSNDPRYINEYRQAIATLRNDMELQESEPNRWEIESQLAVENERLFFKIVNITRNYTYLINVVMAGSASEIIYHSKSIADDSATNARVENAHAASKLKDRRAVIMSFSVIGIVAILIVPIYFFRLITKPVELITSVFKDLAKGRSSAEIPLLNRDDEIGELAKAANVFKSKNLQTEELLSETKQSFVEQRRLNEELTDAKESMENALMVKSDFLANMSHELRTPLNSVIGYTNRILKSADNLNEKQLYGLEAIGRNGKHLLSLISDILDLSKIEANKMELNCVPICVDSLCEEIISQMQPVAKEKGLILGVNSSMRIGEIVTDRTRLSQILLNLISNGIKYTDFGKVTLEVERKLMPEPHVIFSVIDTGRGIKAQDLDRLFVRFEQLENQEKSRIGHGTGLGLAIVANLAKLLGGEISVASVVDKGSVFTLSHPCENKAYAFPRLQSGNE